MLSTVRDKVFCKPLAILIAPDVSKLFSCMLNSCNLVLRDKTAAMSSATSLPILFLEMLSTVRDEVFCKPLAILIAPDVSKLLHQT